MAYVYVTAIYRIYNDDEYVDKVWERLQLLTNSFPLYIFCSKNDSARVEALPNSMPIYCEFAELDTYAYIKDTQQASAIRAAAKDTKEYMILMNAKTEFIRRLQLRLHSHSPSHYIWLDAGISKIFKDPIASFSELKALLLKPLRTNTIFIPGCWPKHTYMDILTKGYVVNPAVDRTFFLQRITESINWRFCGGFVIVPSELVEPFATAVLHEIVRVRETYGMPLWEVNIWAALEDTLPIQWEKGDHNENIYSGVPNFYLPETAPSQPETEGPQ